MYIIIVYAMIVDGKLCTLGIEPLDRFVISGDAADRLERFVTDHDLRLVHWPSRTLFASPKAAMDRLRGNESQPSHAPGRESRRAAFPRVMATR